MRSSFRQGALAIGIVISLSPRPASTRTRSANVPTAGDFVGTWRLVSWKGIDTAGTPTFPMGRAAEGRLTYDALGNVSVHLMNPDRPRFAGEDWAAGSDAEIRAAFTGYFGYYGRYSIDASRGIVTHHIEGCSFPNRVGLDQVRHFKLEGDRLTLVTPPLLIAGRQLTQTLVWIRAQ